MSFTPDILQKPLIVNKVVEYKNGVMVGSSMREMTFIILNNCANNPPSGNVGSNTLNTGVLSNNVVSVCVGTPSVSFTINPTDPDGDTIALANTSVPTGAVINVLNNNTPNPTVSFSWNTTNIPAGNYTFYLTYKDNGCPLSAQQTQAYTIQIVPLPTLTPKIIYPTQCYHKAYVELKLVNGLMPRNVQLVQNGNVIKTYIDTTGTITDSLAAGVYTAQMNYAGTQCINSQTFQIKDSGQFPFTPIVTAAYYCRGDQPQPLMATPTPYSNATINWYTTTLNSLPAAPVPSTATPGVYYWLVSQKYNVCESAKDTAKVYVTNRPTAEFTYPPTLCTNDTASIVFSGSTTGGATVYHWTWNNPNFLSGSNGGPYRVKWDTAGTKTVTLQVVENNCASTITAHTILSKISPVARFSSKDICVYDSVEIKYNVAQPLPGALYYWNFDLGASPYNNTAMGPHTIHWDTPGDKSVFLQVSLDGCYDSSRRTVKVFPQPVADILNTPETVCYGDKIYLRANITGGSSFSATWTPKERIFTDPEGAVFTYVMQPTTYTVSVTNEFNCGNTDSITYTTVEPCCNFSYPTAFTPNGDGKNDHFSIITYGNDNKYELRIFDRWGQQVFVSFNQHDSWDGTHNGKPCEMGTYFYMFKARCMTGREEEQKGEITLVR
jgi:gliding motility-associated-like protein